MLYLDGRTIAIGAPHKTACVMVQSCRIYSATCACTMHMDFHLLFPSFGPPSLKLVSITFFDIEIFPEQRSGGRRWPGRPRPSCLTTYVGRRGGPLVTRNGTKIGKNYTSIKRWRRPACYKLVNSVCSTE